MSKVDDLIIETLGARRTQLQSQIDTIEATPLDDLKQELADIESKLKEIDPSIASIAEDRAAEAAQAAMPPLGVKTP